MQQDKHEGKVTIRLAGMLDNEHAGEVEAHITTVIDQANATEITLDATNLESITSAGLHVIMRLIKRLGQVTILEANDDVYAALAKTGITGKASVHRRPRELSVDDCDLVGQGVTASVYRLDHDTIAKVFNANIPREAVEQEYHRAKAAFLTGVPTAIAYETIRVGERFGTVFEMLEGRELLDVIADDKEHLVEWVTKYARVVRGIHTMEVNPSDFADSRAQILDRIPELAGTVVTEEEAAALAHMYEMLPERHTFLHGDCHPGNVIVRNGELVLIDLADGGMGHPVIDLLSMCLSYRYMTMYGPEMYEQRRPLVGVIQPFSYDEACRIWDTFLRVYFDTDDETFLAKAESQILAYAALKLLVGTLDAPGSLPEDVVQSIKRIALDYASLQDQLCF